MRRVGETVEFVPFFYLLVEALVWLCLLLYPPFVKVKEDYV